MKKLKLLLKCKQLLKIKYLYVLIIFNFIFLIIYSSEFTSEIVFYYFKSVYLRIQNKAFNLNELNYKYSSHKSYINEFNDFLKFNKKEISSIKLVIFDRNIDDNYNNSHTLNHICPFIPPNLTGKINVEQVVLSYVSLNEKFNSSLAYNSGGHWKPKTCLPNTKVAIIVPYRDREQHLKLFLNHMHAFLQKQLIEYSIYIVEQVVRLTKMPIYILA